MKEFSTFLNARVINVFSTGLLFLSILFLIIHPNMLHAQQGVAHTQIPDGGFAIDGNLLARTPVTAPFSADDGDFLPNDNAPGNGGYVFTSNGIPLDTSFSFHIIDGFGSGDADIFTQGSKFNDDPNDWVWKEGKAPGKDDINHLLFHFSADSLGNIWFVGSGDRLKVKGNTYLDFELLQQPLYQNPDYTFSSMGMHGGRTIGDLAFTVEYTIGGTNPQLIVYQWTETSPGSFGYEMVTPDPGTYFLATNSDSAVVVPYGAFGEYTYQKSAFTEVAVNINEVVPGNYACIDIKTVLAKTKASQSYNAALKDLVSPVQVDISSHPEVSVNDTTICYGDTAMLTASVISGTGGPYTYNWSTGDTTATIYVAPDTTTTYWVVVAGANGCPSDTAYGTVTVLPLPDVSVNDASICYGDTAMLTATVTSGTGPFTYMWTTGDTTQSIYVSPDTTTTYGVVVTGSNGCPSDTAFGTVTVFPLPDCFISGPDTICPLGLEQFTGPDTMSLYAWTVYGPAMIVGDTSAQMVEVQALGSCDSTFILELYVMDTNGCASLCSMTVALIDTLPPVITDVPDSLFVDCFDDVPVASIDSVTVTDNCNGNVYVTVSDSVYNDTLCPNQLSIIRTWTATDTCGNYAMATQFINVFDSIPPMIADVPDSLYVECFSEVPVASVDSVTVTDNCDMNPFVTVSDSIFNDTLCPNQLSIIRTWTATDTCGNYSMASQFINVFDSIAPVLYDVPVDTGYCCPDSVPPPANVTAFDNCDGQVIVAFTEFVYDSTGPYMFFINRTWTAEDTCQNFASATQIIEVNDSLYPGGGNVFIPSNDDFVLYFNTSPNPFTNQLNIEFSLAQSSDVILDVYDFTGIKIGTIFEGNVPALEGVKHEMSPDAGMKNGIYMIVLRTQYGIASKRVLLIR